MAHRAHPLDPDATLQPRRRAAGLPDARAAAGLAVVGRQEAAGALLDPTRRRILEALKDPGSSTSVAATLGLPRQRVNYHLRTLEKAGLVEEVGRRQRRGLEERLVRATATHYLISPEAVGRLGGTPADAADRFSATYQVAVAARTIREVAAMAELARVAGKRLTTLSIDTEVAFSTPAARASFADELLLTINTLVAKYHDPAAANNRRYRLFAGAHPVYRPDGPAPQRRTKRRLK